MTFRAEDGIEVPNLAENVIDLIGETGGDVAILAGGGGNGSGGLCCARHLHMAQVDR